MGGCNARVTLGHNSDGDNPLGPGGACKRRKGSVMMISREKICCQPPCSR